MARAFLRATDPLATFVFDGKRVIANWHDAGYRDEIEAVGVAGLVGTAHRELRPRDGGAFFDALERAYSHSTEMWVTTPQPVTAPHRCPRCGAREIHGAHQNFESAPPGAPEREIDEFFCPHCGLFETADSAQPDGPAILARWRRG